MKINRRDFLKASLLSFCGLFLPTPETNLETVELSETMQVTDCLDLSGQTLRSVGFPAVKLYPGASICNGVIETDNIGILLENDSVFSMSTPTRISNIRILGNKSNPSGAGILLRATQGNKKQFIKGIFIDNISCSFLDYGIHVQSVDDGGDQLVYINACIWSNIFLSWCKVGVQLERVGNPNMTRVTGHIFSNIQMQPKPNFTNRMIICDGKLCQFNGMLLWDWPSGYAFEFTDLSQRNTFISYAVASNVLDNGWKNEIRFGIS